MKKRRTGITGLAIFVAALLLGLFRGGKYSLWNDEGFSVADAHLHLGALISFSIKRDPHTTLYQIVLHYWIALNGDGEAWIRSLSAIFAAAAAVFLWLTMRKLFSDRIAAATAALFVVNGFFVAYAQEARQYGLTLMLVCAAMYVFVSRRWLLWAIVGPLSFYAHPFAVVPVVIAHVSLFTLKERPRLRSWIGVAVIQLVLSVPLLLMLASQKQEHIDWVPPLSLTGVAGAANQVTGHGGPGMTLLVCLLVLVMLLRTLRNVVRHEQNWAETLLIMWALALPLALVVVTPFKHVLVPRYLTPAVPGVIAVAVLSISKLKLREYKVGAGVLAALFAMVSVNTYFTHGAKDDWRTAAQYVAENAKAGDAIIISYDQRNVFQYYFLRNGGQATSAPAPLSPLRPWGSRIPVAENKINTSSAVTVAQAVAPYTRVWSLYLSDEPYPRNLQMGLQTVFTSGQTKRFEPRVIASLYSRA